MQNQMPQTPDLTGLPIPSRDQAYDAGLHQLATLLNRDEHIWLTEKTFEEQYTFWRFEILRRGAMARWILQRYRYDGQSETLYFIGERQIGAQELSDARRTGEPFPIAAWQSRA
jgi:hypothetical protein